MVLFVYIYDTGIYGVLEWGINIAYHLSTYVYNKTEETVRLHSKDQEYKNIA